MRYIFLALLYVFIRNTYSQTPAEYYHQGLQLSQDGKYTESLVAFQKIKDGIYELPALVGEVKVLYLMKKYSTTIVRCNEGLEKYPQQNDLLYYRAKCYLDLSKWKSARQDLETIRSQYPNNVSIRYSLGYCYQQEGILELAKNELEIVLSLYPKSSLALQQLGIIYFQENQLAQAQEYFEKAITLQKDLSVSHYYLGLATEKLQNPAISIGHFKEALQYAPQDAESWKMLGKLYVRQKDWPNALISYQKAFEYAPEHTRVDIRLEQANIFYQTQQYSLALENIEYVFANSQQPSGQLYYLRGMIHLALQDNKLALENFEKATELYPDLWDAYLEKAKIYNADGRYSQAIIESNRLINLDKVSAEVYLCRGTARFKLLKYEEAKSDYTEAIKIQVDCIQAYIGRYKVYLKLAENAFGENKKRQYDLAIAELTSAIAFSPKADYYNKRAELHYLCNSFEQARLDVERAIELEPNHPEFYYHLGMIHRTLENWKLSLEQFTIAIEKEPKYIHAYHARAIIHEQLKNWDKSLNDYTTLIGLAENDPKFYLQRAKIFVLLKTNTEQGLRDIEKFFSFNPNQDLDVAFSLRSAMYIYLGELDKALSDITRAIEKKEKQEYYLLRSNIYRKLNQNDNAEKDLEKAEEWND